MKFYQSGRSMVEMLGVLAIIGVLSVGAIAGYSKAMFKYKLNKQAEAINILLNNALSLLPKIDNTSSYGNAQYYASIMEKLNLLPDGISLNQNNDKYLSDVFQNQVFVYSYPDLYGIGYQFIHDKYGESSREICRNLVNVYKANSTDIKKVITQKQFITDDDNIDYDKSAIFYGDSECSANVNCLKNLSLNDIDRLCNQCNENFTSCILYVTW